MAQCDVQTLLDSAACFSCVPPGMWPLLEIQLLCEILNSGGGGGGGGVQQVFPGHYANTAPGFTPPAAYAIAPDLDAPFEVWVWNPDTSAWE